MYVKAHYRININRPSVQSDFFKVFTIIIISRSILPGQTPNYRSPVDQHIEIHTLYEIDKSCNQVRLSSNISYNIKITTLTRNGDMKFLAQVYRDYINNMLIMRLKHYFLLYLSKSQTKVLSMEL